MLVRVPAQVRYEFTTLDRKDQSTLEMNRCIEKEAFNPFLGLMQLLPGIRDRKCGMMLVFFKRLRQIVTVVCKSSIIQLF